jgi:hypothetical protein
VPIEDYQKHHDYPSAEIIFKKAYEGSLIYCMVTILGGENLGPRQEAKRCKQGAKHEN